MSTKKDLFVLPEVKTTVFTKDFVAAGDGRQIMGRHYLRFDEDAGRWRGSMGEKVWPGDWDASLKIDGLETASFEQGVLFMTSVRTDYTRILASNQPVSALELIVEDRMYKIYSKGSYSGFYLADKGSLVLVYHKETTWGVFDWNPDTRVGAFSSKNGIYSFTPRGDGEGIELYDKNREFFELLEKSELIKNKEYGVWSFK